MHQLSGYVLRNGREACRSEREGKKGNHRKGVRKTKMISAGGACKVIGGEFSKAKREEDRS